MFARPNALPIASAPVTPLFATLIYHSQLTENKTTLSPAFATLTRFVMAKSFACHSYEKTPGVCVTHRIANCRQPFCNHAMPAHVGPEPCATFRLSDVFPKPSNVFSSHRRCAFLQFFALFCTAQNVNSSPFNHFRALAAKTPGVWVMRCLGPRFYWSSRAQRRICFFRLVTPHSPLLSFSCIIPPHRGHIGISTRARGGLSA
jgi:hypothetical protein